MPKEYPQKARDYCLSLYLKYGGDNYEAIQRDMRKEYPSWSKQLLFSKGTGKNGRLGWVDRFGFENALKLHLETKIEKVLDERQKRYKGIKSVCDRLQKKADSEDATATDLDKYAKFCDLELKAFQQLDLSRSNLETFAEGYELIGEWLKDIDLQAARSFAKAGDKLIERAEIYYGKAEQEANDE